MQGVVRRRYPGVRSVCRENVLGEVVRADGKEIDTGRQGLGQEHGRWHLDHHAYLRFRRRLAFLQQLAMSARQQPQGLIELNDLGDHGKQYLQVLETRIGTQQRAQLNHEYLGVRQRETNPANTQERVVLLKWEIRKDLVTPNVECAYGHRPWREAFQQLAVALVLLLFDRKDVA